MLIKGSSRTRLERSEGGRGQISHAHARMLAYFWEEPDRPDFSVTVLARTGAIREDTEPQLARDYEALAEAARRSSDPGVPICQHQIECLLEYVRRNGLRDPVDGWREFLDDGEFRTHTRDFIRERARVLDTAPRTQTPREHIPREMPADATAGDLARPGTTQDQPPKGSIFEQLGGAAAIRAAVDLFYDKLQADRRVAHYFDGISLARLKAHQRAFITAVTGGEQGIYADMDVALDRLRAAHSQLKVTRRDFNIVVEHLVNTLAELGVDANLIAQLAPRVLQLRDAIVTIAPVHPFRKSVQHAKESGMERTSPETIYTRIGGADAVRAAVDLFYEKVLGDRSITHYFEGINVGRLKAHQRAMITAVAGGPNAYTGRSMHDAHKHLHITNDAFDTVVGHLVATLQELGVAQEDIDELAPTVLDLRGDIVTA